MSITTSLDLTPLAHLPAHAVLRVVPIEGGAPPDKAKALLAVLDALLAQWREDGKIRRGAACLAAGDCLLLVAYELSGGDLSGCTKDQLTHTLLDYEGVMGRRMLSAPRMAVERPDGAVDFLTQPEFRERRAAGAIDEASVVFDHLVATLGEARDGKLRTTVGASWYAPVGAR